VLGRVGGNTSRWAARLTAVNYALQDGILDPNGKYPTFDLFPAGIGTSYQTYGAPYVTTLILNYKKGPLAISPAQQRVSAGQR